MNATHSRRCLRLCSLVVASLPLQGLAQQAPGASKPSHDFDFEIGTWKTRLSRLQHPLTGSTTWVAYEGTTVVRKVWNGRANLVELEVDGPAGHIEGLSLRLYNPESRQWSLNFANSNGGALSPPTIGGFKDGRGEFFGQETLDGRARTRTEPAATSKAAQSSANRYGMGIEIASWPRQWPMRSKLFGP